MRKTVKAVLVAAGLAVAVAGAASTSADAHPWGGPGPVIGAGILGVAIGASLAHPYYGAPPAYYAGPGYYGYADGCRAYWRWSPRFGRYVRDERCY